ncbi:MAG TPA: hypothetical protein VMF12_14300 [Xanthobacteraceae bacterium]|nr:hypothetical protein [Xanthobacteraceae bacterium]
MQKPLLAAVAAATILLAATFATSFATSSVAMPLAPVPLGAGSADGGLLKPVANICGMNGCAPVWTKRIQKPPANFVKRAVPMTVVPASEHQNSAPLAPIK